MARRGRYRRGCAATLERLTDAVGVDDLIADARMRRAQRAELAAVEREIELPGVRQRQLERVRRMPYAHAAAVERVALVALAVVHHDREPDLPRGFPLERKAVVGCRGGST